MLINSNRKALTEVYEIINLLPQTEYRKIPLQLIKYIKENMDEEYEVSIKEIEDGNMLLETNNILATIYVKYLATNPEKNIIRNLIELEKDRNSKKQNIKRNKEMFNKKEKKEIENELIVAESRTGIAKILNKLKQFIERIKIWKK